MNDNNYLVHHGVKGMKWGVRRYQNEDGTLTKAGKAHRALTSKTAKRIYTAAGLAGLTLATIKTKTGRAAAKKTADVLKKSGKKFVDALPDTIAASGKTITTILLTGGGILALDRALSRKLDEEKAAKVISYGRKTK